MKILREMAIIVDDSLTNELFNSKLVPLLFEVFDSKCSVAIIHCEIWGRVVCNWFMNICKHNGLDHRNFVIAVHNGDILDELEYTCNCIKMTYEKPEIIAEIIAKEVLTIDGII